jgi:hypothetical protein
MILALLGLLACQLDTYPAPIQGSTYRISAETKNSRSDIELDILATDKDCAYTGVGDASAIALCRPKVDRGRAETHLSFALLDQTFQKVQPESLERQHVEVIHAGTVVKDFELFPYQPTDAKQLFIIVIDQSGSMDEVDDDGVKRIKKVKSALRNPQVQEAFFPAGEATTAVVLAEFTDRIRPLGGGDGDDYRILKGRRDYLEELEQHLERARGGYTHLYGAARESTNKLLKTKAIRTWLGTQKAKPTIILLTDGFNNEDSRDTCETNVERLQKTLQAVERNLQNNPLNPVLHTVGLGAPYRPGEMPEPRNKDDVPPVRTKGLCDSFGDRRIDGDLETQGIDHVSLAWLAQAGDGKSYVRRKARTLAKVFADTAAKRYRWFQVRYRAPHPIWHRQAFDVSLRLQRGYQAQSTVTILPNPWLDAPSATAPGEERWMRLTPLRHAFSVLLPLLGGFIFFSFLGAAFFNASRALFRRVRPRDR